MFKSDVTLFNLHLEMGMGHSEHLDMVAWNNHFDWALELMAVGN